jgi:hypothetical protein
MINAELTQVAISFGPSPTYVQHNVQGPFNGEDLGLMWLDWVRRLNADLLSRYDLILLVPKKTVIDQELLTPWGNVKRFDENSGVQAWPRGPNLVFQQILWFYVHEKLKGPFLWCEPDCVPVKPDWLDRLAHEYARCQKPFMGAVVEAQIANGSRIPKHLTGNAVYPHKAYEQANKIMEAANTPWDVWAAEQILPKSHFTKAIQHEYRHPEIKSPQELATLLKPETLLFHADKFGAIARIMSAEPIAVSSHVSAPAAVMTLPPPENAPAGRPEALPAMFERIESLFEHDDQARAAILEFCNLLQSKERSRIARAKFRELEMKFQIGDALSTLSG